MVAIISDPRIRYFHGENRGPAYARNRAFEQANGDLVAFLDSDDEWMPAKLQAQVQAMEKHPQIDLLFMDFINIDEVSGRSSRTFEQYSRTLKSLKVDKYNDGCNLIVGGLLDSLADENLIATDTVMILRRIIESQGGFNEELRSSEDFEFWWRLCLAGIRFAYLDELGMTRYKPVNSLSRGSVLNFQDQLSSLDLCTASVKAAGKPELADLLKPRYRNTWQNLILAYGAKDEKKLALSAFQNSLNYGFRFGSLRVLLIALLGIESIFSEQK